jgi:hypothetical protein
MCDMHVTVRIVITYSVGTSPDLISYASYKL